MRARITATIDGNLITEEMMWDWLVTAFEGGSNYWIDKVNISKETRKLHDMFYSDFDSTESGWRWYHQVPFILTGSEYKGHELEIDTPDGKKSLTIRDLFDGVRKMAGSIYFEQLISENYDAITADIFLQYSLFGEVVFG
tara:strand:- start:64 stop:483 length:420 start_codon:yes stop_codon:yes gene_type:complete